MSWPRTEHTVASLVDEVALELVGTPPEDVSTAVAQIMVKYDRILARRFPLREAEREEFLVLFCRQLRQRWHELAVSGGTSGSA